MTMSVSTAWDETAALARAQGWRLFGLAFLFLALPGAAVRALAPVTMPGRVPATGLWLALVPLLCVASLIGALAISHIALQAGAGLGAALRRGVGWKRLLTLLCAALLVAGTGLLLAMPLLLLAAGATRYLGEDGLLAAWLGLVALFLMMLILVFWTRMVLLTPIAAAEELGPMRLILRSWDLTRGHFWRLLGALLVVLGVSLVVMIASSLLVGLLVALIAGRPAPGGASMALILLVSALVQAVISGIFTIFVARLYAQRAGAG
jgi:hypothetical protein